MWFFTAFSRSLYRFAWIREQKNNSGRAWSYFFLLVFFVSGLTIIPSAINLPNALHDIRTKVAVNAPDFQAVWKSGELQVSGLEQPYVLRQDGMLLVVNTAATNTVSLMDYVVGSLPNSAILIARDRMEVTSVGSQSRVQYWKDMPDYSTSKTDILAQADKFLRTPVMIALILGMFLLFFVGITISKLILAVLGSLIMLGAAKIGNSTWTFKQIFNASLYSITVPTIVALLLGLVGQGMGWISLVLLLLALWMVVLRDKADIAVV